MIIKRLGEHFQVHISHTRCEIDMRLLLDINRKSYMESPNTPLDLTLSEIERSKSRSPRFQRLISRYGATLGSMYY